jgi:hypothetical protein
MTAVPKPRRKRDKKALKAAKAELFCVAEGWFCRDPMDCAHIRSRGSGGPDEPWNLVSLCRHHHAMQHSQGWKWMSEHFPGVREALLLRGWTWGANGRLSHKKLEAPSVPT